MGLTVLEFAEQYGLREPDASKILRVAARKKQLTFIEDRNYLRTYSGTEAAFLAVWQAHLQAQAARKEARKRKPPPAVLRPPLPRPSLWAPLISRR